MDLKGKIAGVMKYKDSFDYFNVEKFIDIYEILLNQIEKYSKIYLEHWKEKDILKREYRSNISLNTYVCSKILVLRIICFLQSILFIVIMATHFEFPDTGLIFHNILFEYILHFFFINFSACMLGLAVSGFVKKQEFTLIFAIYMLVQLIFSGILLPIKGLAQNISNFIIGKYAIYIMGSSSNLIEVVKHTKLSRNYPSKFL